MKPFAAFGNIGSIPLLIKIHLLNDGGKKAYEKLRFTDNYFDEIV
jgi:hypothetical protein